MAGRRLQRKTDICRIGQVRTAEKRRLTVPCRKKYTEVLEENTGWREIGSGLLYWFPWGGTNLQAILNAEQRGEIPSGKVVLAVSDRPGAYALERAKKAGVPALEISRKTCGSREAFEKKLQDALTEAGAEILVLAGFLSILSADFTARYPRRILNVHPSLIPSFCGAGYYGLKVHQAALNRGVRVTGATVHFVNEIPDGGEIIAQKAVDVLPGDTPEMLQQRVMEQAEWILLPRAVEQVCGEIRS